MDKKEQAKLRMRKMRNKESVTESPDSVTNSVTSGSVTKENVTQCPAIIHALTDNREMLEKVYQSLKTFNVATHVYYGYPGLGGVPFDVVGDYLEATS